MNTAIEFGRNTTVSRLTVEDKPYRVIYLEESDTKSKPDLYEPTHKSYDDLDRDVKLLIETNESESVDVIAASLQQRLKSGDFRLAEELRLVINGIVGTNTIDADDRAVALGVLAGSYCFEEPVLDCIRSLLSSGEDRLVIAAIGAMRTLGEKNTIGFKRVLQYLANRGAIATRRSAKAALERIHLVKR